MAQLAALTAVETDWIAPGGDADDIEFRTSGYTDDFTDMQAEKHRRLARAYGNEVSRVPMKLLRKANIEALLATSVFGIRNLTDAKGEEVPWDTVKGMVFEDRYRPLADAMFRAAALATARRAADVEDGEGNSVAPSGSSSNGDSSASS